MSTLSQNHYPLLDWLRFLSAFLVVLAHARPHHWVAWAELSTGDYSLVAQAFFLLTRPGRQAVVVFFVLSGYLVGGRLIQRVSDGSFSFYTYAIDRITRIFIPLIPALVLTSVCVFLANGGFPSNYAAQLLCNIGQLQGVTCLPLEGNPSLWSLNYEVWFYVVAGLLALFFSSLPNANRVSLRVILLGLLLLLGFWALSLLEGVYFFSWILGAIAAIRPISIFGIHSVAGRLAGLLIGVIISQLGGYSTEGSGGLLYVFGTLFVSAFTASLLPWLVSPKTLDPLNAPLLRAGAPLAAFSYTLYLTHYPLLYLMRTWHSPFATFSLTSLYFYAIKVLACLFVAWLFYLPFERNTSTARRWLTSVIAPQS